MKLHKLHVHQRSAGMIGQRVAVAAILPTVAGDLVGSSDTARRQHHGLGAEQLIAPALTIVSECAHHAATIGEQRDHCALHVEIDALMYTVIL